VPASTHSSPALRATAFPVPGRVATAVHAVRRSSSSSSDDSLVDTIVTVFFGAALLLSAAYMLAAFDTGGTAGALAARPFALPAATLLLLAKFCTNTVLLAVEAACAALYQVPSGLAVPVSLLLMFWRMRAARAARREATDRFVRDNPEVVAQARGRLATASRDDPGDDIDALAGDARRRGAALAASNRNSMPSTVIVRADRPSQAAAAAPAMRGEQGTTRIVMPTAAPTASSMTGAAPSLATARAVAAAADVDAEAASRQATLQARAAEARAAAIAKAKTELRAKAAAVAAAAAAVSLDALPVTAAQAPPLAAPTEQQRGREVVPPPFFRSAATPAAAAAAEAAARAVIATTGASAAMDEDMGGTRKVKAGSQSLTKMQPPGPRSLKDLSLLELGALAAQLVARDAISGTVSLTKKKA